MHTPFARDVCITQDEYDSIFDHDLDDQCKKSLEFATFNAGYDANIPIPNRAVTVATAVSQIDADVICLQ